MNQFEFYTGERRVDEFTLPLHGGKALLSCKILERWEERTGRSLNCGLRRMRTLKKTIGVRSVELEELESTISGSFGLEGIAGFKSEVKGKLSKEISFEEIREEEEEFEFEAPKCGRKIVRVYQLVRIYQLSFQDFRSWLFRKGDLFKVVTEGVDRIYDRSIEIKNDPDCGCDSKLDAGYDGLVKVGLNKIGMLVGYKHIENGIEFPTLGMSLPVNNIQQLLFHTFTLERHALPSYLLFLAGESNQILTAQFQQMEADSESALSSEVIQSEPSKAIHRSELSERKKLGSKIARVIDDLAVTGLVVGAAALVFRVLSEQDKRKGQGRTGAEQTGPKQQASSKPNSALRQRTQQESQAVKTEAVQAVYNER